MRASASSDGSHAGVPCSGASSHGRVCGYGAGGGGVGGVGGGVGGGGGVGEGVPEQRKDAYTVMASSPPHVAARSPAHAIVHASDATGAKASLLAQ